MFLKSLKIENSVGNIRDIAFHKGLNLIIDETTTDRPQSTGNNVGKTTVLKLIDFCLGGDGSNIYKKDSEFKEKKNTYVEDYLKDRNTLITLILKENLSNPDSAEIVIKKNFLQRTLKIQEINGENFNDKEFNRKLKQLLFLTDSEKPTFRQIIAKNIRYEKSRLDNTLKVLHNTTTFEQYEALFFFWLGIDTDTANRKQKLQLSKSTEEGILKRLKRDTSLSEIRQALSVIERDINDLNLAKSNFNLNADYKKELASLSGIKADINKFSTQLSRLTLRRDIIFEAKEELEKEYAQIDTPVLKEIYDTAHIFIKDMHAKFEEMVSFHNQMLVEKIKFISEELPNLEKEIETMSSQMRVLIDKEKTLSALLKKSDAIEELELIINALTKKYQQKGKYEEQLRQWEESTKRLEQIELELSEINQGIALRDNMLESRIVEFNKFFSKISQKLYGEQFILSHDKNERAYELKIGSIGGLGTGKKKGQIAAFDIAYVLFCDENEIPCLHFILHDQVETIHDNQLSLIAEVVNETDVQFIIPVLKDKLPPDLNTDIYKILELSQSNKLFNIEHNLDKKYVLGFAGKYMQPNKVKITLKIVGGDISIPQKKFTPPKKEALGGYIFQPSKVNMPSGTKLRSGKEDKAD